MATNRMGKDGLPALAKLVTKPAPAARQRSIHQIKKAGLCAPPHIGASRADLTLKTYKRVRGGRRQNQLRRIEWA